MHDLSQNELARVDERKGDADQQGQHMEPFFPFRIILIFPLNQEQDNQDRDGELNDGDGDVAFLQRQIFPDKNS